MFLFAIGAGIVFVVIPMPFQTTELHYEEYLASLFQENYHIFCPGSDGTISLCSGLIYGKAQAC